VRADPWRRPLASLNYLLSSHIWRQDHNRFTHQDPGFLDVVMTKKTEVVRVYLPPDANTLLSTYDHCLRSRQWSTSPPASSRPVLSERAGGRPALSPRPRHLGVGGHREAGAAGTARRDPDVVLACAGDIPTLETLAAAALLRERLPDLAVRVVDVVDLMRLLPDFSHPHGLPDHEFDALFTTDRPVIFAFHGYPYLVHRLT
jgi:xylulose-5-phosphate/fructose-6-phosphate phosphoketolase